MPVVKYGFRALKRARIEETKEEEKVLKVDSIESEVELIGELINNKMECGRKIEPDTLISSNQETNASKNILEKIDCIESKAALKERIKETKNISDNVISAEEKEVFLAPLKNRILSVEEKIINFLKMKDTEISKLSFEKESLELSHQKARDKMKNLMMTTQQMMNVLRQENSDLTLKVLEKEKELDSASKSSEGMESSLKLQLQKQTSQDELIKTLSSEKNSLQEAKAVVEADLKKLREEQETLNDKLRLLELEKQEISLKQSNSSLEAEIKIQSLIQENRNISSKLSNLEKEAENVQSDKLLADTKYTELNNNYINLQESFKALEVKFAEKKEGSQEKEQIEKVFSDKIAEIEDKNKNLETENQELKVNNKNIQLEYKQLEQKVAGLKDEMLLFEEKEKNCKKCIESQNEKKVFEKKIKYEKYQMKSKYKERMHNMDKLVKEKEEKIKTLTEELDKRNLANVDTSSNVVKEVHAEKENMDKASEITRDKTKEVTRDPRLRPSKEHNTEKSNLRGLLKKVDKWKNMNIRDQHQPTLNHHQYYRNNPYSQNHYQNNFNPSYYYNGYHPPSNNYYHGYEY